MLFSKLAVFFLILTLLTFTWWYFGIHRPAGNTGASVADGEVVITTSEGEVVIPVELAESSAEKIQGLSDRESLPQDSGMLFVWDMDVRSTFSMRRMRFPLDILFITGTGEGVGEVLSISADLSACPDQTTGCETASAPGAFRYVLEVNGGFAEEHGIEPGDSVSVRLAQ